MSTTPKRHRRRRLGTTARVGLAAAAAATLVGIAASAASASPTSHTDDDTIKIVAYTQEIKPWQTVSLPAFSCPADYPYLENSALSPGIVPPGVKVEQTGAIGVNINGTDSRMAYKYDKYYIWSYGTLANGVDGDIASATNWDITQNHELQIDLYCTSNFVKGGGYPS
jgi:hypothetical protein